MTSWTREHGWAGEPLDRQRNPFEEYDDGLVDPPIVDPPQDDYASVSSSTADGTSQVRERIITKLIQVYDYDNIDDDTWESLRRTADLILSNDVEGNTIEWLSDADDREIKDFVGELYEEQFS